MVDRIREQLWLGDMQDALAWPDERLCVLEQPPGYGSSLRDHWIHILEPHPQRGMVARRGQLDKAAELITARLEAGARLLVHCGAGIERSPLTLAWWLVRTGQCPDLPAAYVELRAARAVVQDRIAWLEPA